MEVPERIGRFEIQSEIGRGGMAVVYKAADSYMEREVALKVLSVELMHREMYRNRFEREIRTISRLEHPAIVPIYEAGQSDEFLFIVMKLMEGGSLVQQMRQRQIELPELKKIVHRICWALDTAHDKQIIHRDIKPDNILLDRWGDAFLSDFGVTKVLNATRSLTSTNQPIGTPYYMSPEQVEGKPDIDGRCDIYGLGVLLFQLLTNELPYTGKTPMSIAYAHVNQAVPRILDYRPDLPPAFDEIIMTAMAKEPADRYHTAGELGQAVARVDQSPSNISQLPSNIREESGYTLVGADTDLYAFLPHTLQQYKLTERNRINCSPVRHLAASPQTSLIAVAADQSVWLYDLKNQDMLNVLGNHNDFVWSMSWHPSGNYLASGGKDNTVRIWDLASHTEQQSLTDPQSWIWEVAWSPDGMRLASGVDDGRIYIWDTRTWQVQQILAGHDGAVTTLAWANNAHIASGGDDGMVRVWQLPNETPLHTLTGHVDRVRCLKWDSQNKRLASGGSDGTIRIWQGSQQQKQLSGHQGWVERLIWTVDDTVLVSAGSYGDSAIYLWDVQQNKLINKIADHTRPVFGLTWLTNSPLLLSGSDDGTIRVWGLTGG